MSKQWDKELEDWFYRCVEQDNQEALLHHYYGFSNSQEYEEYISLFEEGIPVSYKVDKSSHPDDDEPDWEWMNDVARGR